MYLNKSKTTMIKQDPEHFLTCPFPCKEREEDEKMNSPFLRSRCLFGAACSFLGLHLRSHPQHCSQRSTASSTRLRQLAGTAPLFPGGTSCSLVFDSPQAVLSLVRSPSREIFVTPAELKWCILLLCRTAVEIFIHPSV